MKEKILQAALDLYTSKPPQNVIVKEIAEKAGISVGLIFYYFKTKDDLEKEVVSYLIEECISVKVSNIEEFVNSSLKMIKEKPRIFRFLQYVFEKEKQKGSKDLALKIYKRGIERLEPLLKELKVENPKKLATLVMALIDGLALYSFFLDLNVEEYISDLIELIKCRGEK